MWKTKGTKHIPKSIMKILRCLTSTHQWSHWYLTPWGGVIHFVFPY
jgi:hypothetical protein